MSSQWLRCPQCQKTFQNNPGPTTATAVCPLCQRIMGWYYAQNNQKFGPVMFGQLCQFADNGSLKPGDHILQEGTTTWVRAGQVTGLFGGEKILEVQPAFSASSEILEARPIALEKSENPWWKTLLAEFLAVPRAMISLPAGIWNRQSKSAVEAQKNRQDKLRAGLGYGMFGGLVVGVLVLWLMNLGNVPAGLPTVDQVANINPNKPKVENKEPAAKGDANGENILNQNASDGKREKLNGKEVYKKILKSTVLIMTHQGMGTGCLIDPAQKLVITNSHVVPEQWISGNTPVTVYFPMYREGKVVAEKGHYVQPSGNPNEAPVTAYVIRRDNSKDLAILKLDRLPQGVLPLKLAKESPGPGDTVHSIGNPGVSDALWVYTSGTVRQVYQKNYQSGSGNPAMGGLVLNVQAKVVETQSPINPGDSGGPVVNEYGELIGVNQSYTKAGQLFGTAIDISEIRTLLTTHYNRTP